MLCLNGRSKRIWVRPLFAIKNPILMLKLSTRASSSILFSLRRRPLTLPSSLLISPLLDLATAVGLVSSRRFILRLQDKLRQYDKLVKDTEHFMASIKRVMLENAVHPIAELRVIKNQADQLKTTSCTALTVPMKSIPDLFFLLLLPMVPSSFLKLERALHHLLIVWCTCRT
jgi:hypothetical protein